MALIGYDSSYIGKTWRIKLSLYNGETLYNNYSYSGYILDGFIANIDNPFYQIINDINLLIDNYGSCIVKSGNYYYTFTEKFTLKSTPVSVRGMAYEGYTEYGLINSNDYSFFRPVDVEVGYPFSSNTNSYIKMLIAGATPVLYIGFNSIDGSVSTYCSHVIRYDNINNVNVVCFNVSSDVSESNLKRNGFSFLLANALEIDIPLPYPITLTVGANGTATVDKQEAESGETVVVTHTPDAGYITNLANTTVKDASGNNVTYTLLTPTSFQFTMPASNVTISVEFKSNDPYSPGGDSAPSTPGGDGEFNNNSDAIPVPDTPQINYSDSGLVRLFSPSAQQVIDFGNYLWSGLIDLDTIIKAFQDPMQNIISFHMVPIAVDKGTSIAVKFAGISTGVNMFPVTKQLYDVSMGSLQFPKYYGSSLDYSPYTQAVLYLPYIGEMPLDVDECIGKTLSISYKIDVFSGNCVAFVAIDGNVFYTKSGNVLQTIPISQSSFSQIIGTASGLLAAALGGASIIGGGIGAISAGTALGGIGNLISQSASIASQAAKPASDLLSVIAGKPQAGHTSLGGGITGFLSVQYPYINIKRVKQSLASSFASEYGYPLNVTDNLYNYTGFVKVSDIVFNGMTSTDAETGEIYNLLRSGIVIYGNSLPVYTAPSTGLKIALEYYAGVPNSPDKPITTRAEITGTFRNGTDITRPTIYIEGYLNTLLNETNMICIPELKRRYYIKEIRVVTANSYEIDLICDVLTSFWHEFKSSLCIIERAQNNYNLMIRDNLFVGQQDRLIQQLKFPNSFSTHSYILALTGNNRTGT